MKVEMTILVENTSSGMALMGEWGFSALLTVDGYPLLFDTGHREALFANSHQLRVPLKSIQEIVLSHGHYDHTGALPTLLAKIGPRPVTAHPGLFMKRYSQGAGGQQLEVGVPFSETTAIAAGAEFSYTAGPREIRPGIFVTGAIPRQTAFEDVGGSFWAETEQGLIEDSLEDDMALVIDHPQGLIVMSGCAHAGIVNTLNYAREITGKTHIQAFIGGAHLVNASPQRLEATISYLGQNLPDRIMIGHCTGFYAAARLYNELGQNVVKIDAGSHCNFI